MRTTSLFCRLASAAAALVIAITATPSAAVAQEPSVAAGQTLATNPADAPEGTVAQVEPQLLAELAAEPTASFWVYLHEQADLSAAGSVSDRAAQGRLVHRQLTRTAAASQAELLAMLTAAEVEHRSYWIANAVRVDGDERLLRRIAALPEVSEITADRTYELPQVQGAPAQVRVDNVEWGVDRINAPQVWDELGVTGAGMVVGSIDSGVQFDHPALVEQYRGNRGADGFDHNYHWHDPSNVCAGQAPCDNTGHGTHVTGTMVGDDSGDNRIGVAPGTRWIAAKGCETNSCSQEALLSSAQFMLAPTDLTGGNENPALRPHVVNNSWGGAANDDPWFTPTVEAWISAGIFPQFANGNTEDGVAECGSSANPGNLPESYAAGAFDIDGNIADLSNRGPSAWDADLIKPNIAAPGIAVRSALPGGGYGQGSGTSMASPHVAGTVALMWSAAPHLERDVDATRDLLDQTAVDTEDLTCGGEPANNNVWGQGKLDAFAAVQAVPHGPTGMLTGSVTDAADGSPVRAVVSAAGDVTHDRWTDPDGSYTIELPVGEYALVVDAPGYEPTTDSVVIEDGQTVSRDFPLQAAEPPPAFTLSGDGYRERGRHTVDLTWQGATSAEIDIHRDRELIATVPNDGQHTDAIGRRGPGSYLYQACEAGTAECTERELVRFGGRPIVPPEPHFCDIVHTIPDSECRALVAIYETNGGPDWTLAGWLTDIDPCTWAGVECDTRAGETHVTRLLFTFTPVTGDLAAEVGDLPYLEILQILFSPGLTGLPDEIGNLAHLRRLAVEFTQVAQLPATVGQLDSLTQLDLSSNQLQQLPEQVGQLSSLERVQLVGNQLESLPSTIDQLVNLESLLLQWNQLTGLPENFGDLDQLRTLDLSGSPLGPTLPPAITDLASLELLTVTDAGLTALPDEIADLTNLVELQVAFNEIDALPSALAGLSTLHLLGVAGNQLTEVPPWVGELPDLRALRLADNRLTELPDALAGLSRLEVFDAGGNELTGPVPDWLGTFADMYTLLLWNNQLSGELPVGLRDGTSVGDGFSQLELSGNGCLTSTADASFTAWLDEHAAGWDDGCG